MGRQVLAVIRHGKRLDEVEAFWRATADRPWDPPLWTEGLVAVELVGEQLASLGFTRMVISPFQRCLETARQLNKHLRLPYCSWQIDSSVCEVLSPKTLVGTQLDPPVGLAKDWMWGQGTLRTALDQVLGETAAAEVTIANTSFPPFPETAEQAHVRYTHAFEEIADRFPSENVLIVSHGEAVGRAVSRILPHVIVYDVQHCGYAMTWREQEEDGEWGMWQLDETASRGVHWTFR